MSPLVLLWGSVTSFLTGMWLGGLTVMRALERRDKRHASPGSGAETNGPTRATAARVGPQRRNEPWGQR